MIRALFGAKPGRFLAVAAGEAGSYELDPVTRPAAAAELAGLAARLPRRGAEVRRLRLALDAPARDSLLDLLAAKQTPVRLLAVRLCGSLELDEAVPWLESRLADRNQSVREASARALGRIGGARAANSLLRALGRERLPWFRLTVELAKAAPTLFLETALGDPAWQAERAAVLAALGLRRPDLGATELLASAQIAGPRDLVVACHVLARRPGATAWIASLLDHHDRRVRAAADRSLRRLRNTGARPVYVIAGAASS